MLAYQRYWKELSDPRLIKSWLQRRLTMRRRSSMGSYWIWSSYLQLLVYKKYWPWIDFQDLSRFPFPLQSLELLWFVFALESFLLELTCPNPTCYFSRTYGTELRPSHYWEYAGNIRSKGQAHWFRTALLEFRDERVISTNDLGVDFIWKIKSVKHHDVLNR